MRELQRESKKFIPYDLPQNLADDL